MTLVILSRSLELESHFPTDLREDIMKLNEANSLPMVAVSGFLILGAIGFLIFWALQTAYALG
jgi:hypothetical protein